MSERLFRYCFVVFALIACLSARGDNPKALEPPTGLRVLFIGNSLTYANDLPAIVGAAIAISNWVSVTAALMTSVIIIGALLAIGVVGAMQLRNDDQLSEDNFLKLMIESYRRLPLLKGTDESNDQLEK